MEQIYRYKLDKSSKKHNCPQCAKKRFVKYIDEETGQYLPDHYGRCDREDECSYLLDPYKDGYSKAVWNEENNISSDWKPTKPFFKHKPKPPTPIYYFDFETFRKTLKDYERNIFIQNLLHNVPFPFTTDAVTKIIELYRLGTISNGYRAGAITFPFIDINQNVRTIQVKEFNKHNSTKDKGTDFLHSMIERHFKRKGSPPPEWIESYNKNETKVSCLFGEHLLKQYPNNPIALVEAPKTAIYGTLYFGSPDNPKNLLWLAVYSKSTFKFDRVKVLQGRKIVVFPDLSKDGNTFDLWNNRAKEFQKRMKNTTFKTFDLLERMGTHEQKNEGSDIADILIQLDWRKFKSFTPHHEPTTPPQIAVIEAKEEKQAVQPPKKKDPLNVIEINYSDLPFFDDAPTPMIKNEFDYSKEIEEVKQFFENTELPKEPIKLDVCTTVTDCKKVYSSHIPIIENYNGKRIAKPYLDRLLNLKKWIESNNHNKWLSLDELKAIFKPCSNYYSDEVLEHINREQFADLKKDNFFSFDKNVGVYFLSNSTPF